MFWGLIFGEPVGLTGDLCMPDDLLLDVQSEKPLTAFNA